MKELWKFVVLPLLVGVGIMVLAGGVVYVLFNWDIATYIVGGSMVLAICWLLGAMLLSDTRWGK